MQRVNVRGDFVERFSFFMDAYDRARTKEEKAYLAEEFLKSCTAEEVTLVRNVVGDVLHQHSSYLYGKLFS